MHVVVVQCPFLKPYWFCESSCSASRKQTICFIITYDKIGKIEIGRKSLDSLGLLIFGIGLFRDTFHWLGNIFWLIDELMMWHIGMVMLSILIFKYFAGMLSQPVEQSARIDWMAFRTWSRCMQRKIFKDGLVMMKQSIFDVELRCWFSVSTLALIFEGFGLRIRWIVLQTSFGLFEARANLVRSTWSLISSQGRTFVARMWSALDAMWSMVFFLLRVGWSICWRRPWLVRVSM